MSNTSGGQSDGQVSRSGEERKWRRLLAYLLEADTGGSDAAQSDRAGGEGATE